MPGSRGTATARNEVAAGPAARIGQVTCGGASKEPLHFRRRSARSRAADADGDRVGECTCIATMTTPIPPWPSTRSTRDLPAMTRRPVASRRPCSCLRARRPKTSAGEECWEAALRRLACRNPDRQSRWRLAPRRFGGALGQRLTRRAQHRPTLAVRPTSVGRALRSRSVRSAIVGSGAPAARSPQAEPTVKARRPPRGDDPQPWVGGRGFGSRARVAAQAARLRNRAPRRRHQGRRGTSKRHGPTLAHEARHQAERFDPPRTRRVGLAPHRRACHARLRSARRRRSARPPPGRSDDDDLQPHAQVAGSCIVSIAVGYRSARFRCLGTPRLAPSCRPASPGLSTARRSQASAISCVVIRNSLSSRRPLRRGRAEPRKAQAYQNRTSTRSAAPSGRPLQVSASPHARRARPRADGAAASRAST